jgi:aminobenzoyl-glutamate utilization protein B
LFSDVDVVVGWHPEDRNAVVTLTSTATISAKFRFHGVAAHAGSAPDRGRSALDAVEAMDYMVNMMREHVPQETRISYVITRGGAAPNVVPELAEVYYQARQPDMKILDSIWERIGKAAAGAAQGTGTTVDAEITSANYNTLPNDYLAGIMYGNLERVGGFSYTPEEQRFAEQIRKTLTDAQPASIGSEQSVRPLRTAGVDTFSTDLADVSWNVPTVQVNGAAFVPSVPNHSWQATACAGSSIGIKAMMVAAKSMALTTYDLFVEPTHIAKARAEFDQRRGTDFVYTTRLAGRKPPLDYRK